MSAEHRKANRRTGDRATQTGPLRHLDIVIATALALAGAAAFASLPDGSPLRVMLAVGVLFFAPGYLLMQALPLPATPRWMQALLAVGISPAVVGLLALATAIVPGGFRPGPIVGVVTVACLALAGVALYRRIAQRDATARPDRNARRDEQTA